MKYSKILHLKKIHYTINQYINYKPRYMYPEMHVSRFIVYVSMHTYIFDGKKLLLVDKLININ